MEPKHYGTRQQKMNLVRREILLGRWMLIAVTIPFALALGGCGPDMVGTALEPVSGAGWESTWRGDRPFGHTVVYQDERLDIEMSGATISVQNNDRPANMPKDDIHFIAPKFRIVVYASNAPTKDDLRGLEFIPPCGPGIRTNENGKGLFALSAGQERYIMKTDPRLEITFLTVSLDADPKKIQECTVRFSKVNLPGFDRVPDLHFVLKPPVYYASWP